MDSSTEPSARICREIVEYVRLSGLVRSPVSRLLSSRLTFGGSTYISLGSDYSAIKRDNIPRATHVYDGIHLLMNASYPSAVRASGRKPHVEGVDTPESVKVVAGHPQDLSSEECNVYIQGKDDVPAISRKSEIGFGYATDPHVANFLECARAGKMPTAPMALRFPAAFVLQMANMSVRRGRQRCNATPPKAER